MPTLSNKGSQVSMEISIWSQEDNMVLVGSLGADKKDHNPVVGKDLVAEDYNPDHPLFLYLQKLVDLGIVSYPHLPQLSYDHEDNV
jgi:hypothetical protein